MGCPHLLLFSILAVMSGATSYRRIHPFIRTHQARLNEAFGEDASPIRKNPGVFAHLRHFALNRLRHKG